MTTNKTSWTTYINDPNLKNKIKKLAIDANSPVGDLVEEILEEWIEKYKDEILLKEWIEKYKESRK